MGEVHDGDTVMDYMEQERERGITITIAAATIHWRGHRLQLIDTPGHVDFTFEVERSLSVLDGAIVILDASAGVQAQTVKVWRQADRYRLVRLLYLNKMDKPTASVADSIDSIRRKLGVEPLQLQLPLRGKDGRPLAGLVDVITGDVVFWPSSHSSDLEHNTDQGRRYLQQNLLKPDPNLVPFLDRDEEDRQRGQLLEQREHLIGQLAEFDDTFAEAVLDLDHLNAVSPDAIHAAIRQLSLRPETEAVPLLLGSSYRNVGVQPLLNAICLYLPQPFEAKRARQLFSAYNPDIDLEQPLTTTSAALCESAQRLCALAFKIVTDRRLGALTFVRIYSGQLQPGQTIYNVNRDVTEKVGKVYRAFADQFVDITRPITPGGGTAGKDARATIGDIVAVSGLVHTITGDTLVFKNVAKSVVVEGNNAEEDAAAADEEDNETTTMAGIEVPEPVFYCSIEAPSMSKMKQLEVVLEQLQREDPSLKVVHDQVNNQLVIKGMGELHIDIVKDRIKREHGIEVTTGPLQVAYRETITAESSRYRHEMSKTIGGVNNRCLVELEIRPEPISNKTTGGGDVVSLKVINTKERQLSALLKPWHLRWIKQAVKRAFEYGPLLSSPVVSVEVLVHDFETTRRTSQAFITSAIGQCMLEALRTGSPILLEPIMELEIRTPETHLGPILSDLSARRAEFGPSSTLTGPEAETALIAYVPLSELVAYSSALRQLTSGLASFEMTLHSYRAMDERQTQEVLKSVYGVE